MKKISIAIISLLSLFQVSNTEQVTAQTISTFAGTGVPGGAGDGGAATAAQLYYPHGIYVSSTGDRYINDDGFQCIRKVNAAGVITRIAGTGVGGFSGDGGMATAANIDHPFDLVIDASGNIIFSDNYNNRIRKISTTGIITTIAGTGAASFSGDGGPATAAALNKTAGLAIDAAGNIYFGDQYNHRIRKISTTGIITTIVGTGAASFGGDGGPATAAQLSYPNFLIFDNSGDLIITDNGNHRVRKLNMTTGIITTIAGNGSITYTGDGMAATASSLYYPGGVAIDPSGNMYIADNIHARIRMVNTSGIISTVAGTGIAGFSGDGGPATNAKLHTTVDVALDAGGNLYISDLDNNRVRVVNALYVAPSHPPTFIADGCGYLTVCENSTANNVGFLDVSDVDIAQTETYTVIVPPSHGTLSGFPTSVPSTGGIINPTGINYTPAGLYYGTDTFTVMVSDGTLTDTLPFHVDVLPNTAGMIVGADTICQGDTAHMTNYINGGFWSSTNTAIATISGTGLVSALTSGTDTIYYSLPNICNAGKVLHLITVLTREQCLALAVNNLVAASDIARVSPNPNSGTFTIDYFGNKSDAHAILIDMTGRTIASYQFEGKKTKEITIDAATGVYFLSISDESTMQTVKMVIVR